MKRKHLGRTILILAAIVVSLIQIYPTVGWMTLSEDERAARLERWKEEDRVYERPDAWRDMVKGVKRWAEFDRSKVINLGLDLQGGVHMVLGLDMDSVDPAVLQEMKDAGYRDADIVSEFQQMALRTIERRVNEFEAKEPVIQAYGDRQVQIQLPGEKDIDRARRLIMQTAYLEFKLVAGQEETEEVFSAIEGKYPRQFLPYLRQTEPGGPFEIDLEYVDTVREVVANAREEGLVPEGREIAFSKAPKPWDEVKRYEIYLLEAEPALTGDRLNRAWARPDQNSLEGFYHIPFELDAQGGRRMGEVTEANMNRQMAIVVDGVVESAPFIRGKFTTNGEISGQFSGPEAQDLAIALNSGSMPARIRLDFEGVVGATLGADSVRSGVRSAMIGLVLVLVFMLAYYRVAGVIANVSLVVNALLILAAMAYFGATLTLPGIAGLILTIGMAVDANVLIYERIREEIRNGRSVLASIENGFQRAQSAILDANVTTLIAAAVLMQFGTGAIEGFAVTLSIGVCTSVFSALVVSRAVFDFLGERKMLKNLSMASVFKPETHIGFMQRYRGALIGSAVVIVIGLGAFGVRLDSMFGVDFTTGTTMVVNLQGDAPVSVADVRSEMASAGFAEPIVQEFEHTDASSLNRFMIRVSDVESADGDAAGEEAGRTVSVRVQEALASLTPTQTAQDALLERVETVGPAVGAQLKRDALLALLYSLVFIIAYLAIRFEVKFALGAVAALAHDVLITVGLFALLGRQISLPVVAAILTVIGYSLNDTIVIFDRVREDMRLYRGRGMNLLDLMNISVNETLGRTILTSGTTLIVVLVLLFFGGAVIFDFALALCIGILVGTYSSVFVASPLAYFVHQWQNRHRRSAEDEKQSSRRRHRPKKRDKGEETTTA